VPSLDGHAGQRILTDDTRRRRRALPRAAAVWGGHGCGAAKHGTTEFNAQLVCLLDRAAVYVSAYRTYNDSYDAARRHCPKDVGDSAVYKRLWVGVVTTL
jgi:hypothetical protein